MPLLLCTLQAALASFAAWTISVHLWMALGLPAGLVALPFASLLVVLAWLARSHPGWDSARASLRDERGWLLGVAAIGLAGGGLALVLDAPSADDFNFFHRALAQLGALGQPFFLGDTAFNQPDLAAISPLHVLTTWELGIALGAHGLGLDPLGVYHNGTVVVGNLLLAATFASLLRELGLGRTEALVGCAGCLLFLLVDDARLRSFGVAYRMLWVGKMMQWSLLFPLLTLFSLRYLRAPSVSRLLPVACGGVVAVGLSGTGVFLAPALVGCASLAGLALAPISRERLLRCGLLNLGSAYCLVIALMIVVGVFSRPTDLTAWFENYPAQWRENLMISLGSPLLLLRNAALLGLVPALALRGDSRRFLLALSLVLVALLANPLVGEWWIQVLQPGAYWRVMLLFPVPLCAGLALARALVPGSLQASLPARLGAMVALGLVLLGAFVPAPAERRMPLPLGTKSPLALRFPALESRFLREATPLLQGRSLLAGPPTSWLAPLLVRDLRVEAARRKDTRHVFSNAGRPEEGDRRLAAWEWARRCDAFPAGAGAAEASLAGRVDALIHPVCAPGSAGARELQAVLARAPGVWKQAHRGHGYALYLRMDSSPRSD